MKLKFTDIMIICFVIMIIIGTYPRNNSMNTFIKRYNLYKRGVLYPNNTSNIKGNTSNIKGNTSNIKSKLVNISNKVKHISNKVKNISNKVA